MRMWDRKYSHSEALSGAKANTISEKIKICGDEGCRMHRRVDKKVLEDCTHGSVP